MNTLSLSQMEQVVSGRSVAAKIVDGVCYGVLAVDLALPVCAKLGLIAVSPVVGAIVSGANLGCVIWYIAS